MASFWSVYPWGALFCAWAAIPAQGAKDIQLKQLEIAQLTAEQILQDPATSEMWLRSVQHDPANFLAIKFNMQLMRLESPAEREAELEK